MPTPVSKKDLVVNTTYDIEIINNDIVGSFRTVLLHKMDDRLVFDGVIIYDTVDAEYFLPEDDHGDSFEYLKNVWPSIPSVCPTCLSWLSHEKPASSFAQGQRFIVYKCGSICYSIQGNEWRKGSISNECIKATREVQ